MSFIVLSYKKIREFSLIHPDARGPLDRWYKIAEKANWANISNTRQELPHADAIGDYTCFNIGGNKYRLITKINYKKKIIFIKHILTHSEYDKGHWKDDD
ncbi:MAG: type II toxin-antitoxin system HigB family toxin [Blastocatellia bacterium]